VKNPNAFIDNAESINESFSVFKADDTFQMVFTRVQAVSRAEPETHQTAAKTPL